MKLKSIAILFIIILSLLPAYWLYKKLQMAMRPKESMTRFLFWLVTVFALIFAYTFLVVFVIRMLFPTA